MGLGEVWVLGARKDKGAFAVCVGVDARKVKTAAYPLIAPGWPPPR